VNESCASMRIDEKFLKIEQAKPTRSCVLSCRIIVSSAISLSLSIVYYLMLSGDSISIATTDG
jgi:hypothetical protein